MVIPWPEDCWDPPHVEVHLTPGPDRIYDDNPTPPLPTRPVGFRMHKEEAVSEPDTPKWWTYRSQWDDRWCVSGPNEPNPRYFDTHAEAITYADKQARDTD